MRKSVRLITILLAILSAFVFISCDQASVEDLFDDGRGDNPDPGPMSGLVAPDWLVSKSPSAAGAADGIIYGVTPYMEYSFGRNNIWTQCPGGKIEGLSAGNIFVRYAGTEGRLAGEAALVCMDDVSTYDGTPKLLSAEELADYNVLVVNENTGEVEIKKADTLGSYPDVYLIESAKAWNTVATDESTYNGKVLILGDNLDFSETESDEMMSYQFTGKIYGNGYLIKNFTNITAISSARGLIQKAGNGLYLNYVQMTNSIIQATYSYVGSLIGLIGDPSMDTEVKVIGCSVYSGKVITAGNFVGGLIGESDGEKVILTLNHSKILNSTINGNASTGGLIGRIKNTILTTLNCDVVDCWIDSTSNNDGGLLGAFGDGGYVDVGTANIMNCNVLGCTIRGVAKIGGLFGGAYASYPITVTDCHVSNSNLLTNSAGRAGGLIGFINNANANILNCDTSNCNLSGSKDVGGLVGTLVLSSNLNADGCNVLHSNLKGDTATTTGGIIGSVLTESTAIFKNCHAGIGETTALYVSSGIPLNGTVDDTATANFIGCNYATLVDDAWDLTFPTEEEIAVFPESKLPYVYVIYKTARGSMGAPYSDGKMTVSIPYLRSAPFGSSASGNIPKPLDASTDWLMANGKVRNTDPVVSEEVVIADLLN